MPDNIAASVNGNEGFSLMPSYGEKKTRPILVTTALPNFLCGVDLKSLFNLMRNF